MSTVQGSIGRTEVYEDFLGSVADGAWTATGVGAVGRLSFTSVNEGSMVQTLDEPGGIVAITTDIADNDNIALFAGTFQPSLGAVVMEARYKYSNADTSIFCGFTETLSLTTPVMPAEFATATMTYNGTGGMVGIQYDVDGTTDDFRACMGDGGVATGGSGNGTRANADVTADKWFTTRVEIDPSGTARVYHGDRSADGLRLIKTFTAGLTPTDQFHATLFAENRSANARVLEVDYFYASGGRDWSTE